MINYLRLRRLLVAQPFSDPCTARARDHATAISHPAFSAAVHIIIDVLLGQGSTSSRARSPQDRRELRDRHRGHARSVDRRRPHRSREITKKHIEDALEPLRRNQARRLHTAPRCFFRALKRERLVFRDPARHISLTSSRHVPTALPSDRVAALRPGRRPLDRFDDPRDHLMVALVAVYALLPSQLTQLQRTDLDRSKGRLRLRREGRLDHVIYLDAFTLRLATAWELHRHRRWPDSSNPPPLCHPQHRRRRLRPTRQRWLGPAALPRVGLPAGRLRVDRIVDEARHSADPVRLMELFGLSNLSATRYVLSAHPDKKNDPIAP
ncbi:hypothetical protein [Streptomyces cadmiisoli]|uniref:hypothetical protein n=1 Tax=Streptomyces cadmiisoli TaxID=2184053 RepID=UPI0013A6F4F0|nr:hypothetical protein [Streptomyces cadmiisoli]